MIMTDIIENQGAAKATAHTFTVSDPAASATGPHTAAPEQSVPDPFNVSILRLKTPITEEVGTRPVLAHVRVGKPDKQSFFRLNPDPEYRIRMAILELKEENETYAVLPDIAVQFPGEVRQVQMQLGVTTQGVPFLWPIPLPQSDGRENPWHRSARMAAEHAEKEWVRMIANRGAGCYDIKVASVGLPDPQWPSEDLSQLLRIAFGGGKLIDRIDHPVMNRLLGR